MTQNAVSTLEVNSPPAKTTFWFLLAAGATFTVGSFLSLWLNGPKEFSLLWPTNGLLLGFLLLSPKRSWIALFALNFLSSFFLHWTFHFTLHQSVIFSAANLLEVAIAILPLRNIKPEQANLSLTPQLIPFVSMSMLAPAISGAFVIALSGGFLPQVSKFVFFRAWWVGDGLGLLLMTPLVLMTVRRETLKHFQLKELPLTLLLLALASGPNLMLTTPQRIPRVFLDFPILVFVTFRLGLFGAAVSALLMDIPLTHFALNASGMFGANAFHNKVTRLLILQAYLLIQLAMVYLIASTLTRQKQLREQLRKSEERYRTLADNSWDVILQMDAEGKCTYVSPSLEDSLGRKPEDLIHQLACTLVHPEDKPIADSMMEDLRAGAERKRIEIRMEHQDGGYRWMELKCRSVRDNQSGETKEVVAVARDVTSRVMRDMELTAAVQHAENLALTDELTGLGNRRGFEDTLERLWNASVEEGAMMAVLMIDADNFKDFNDTHGHLAGDECLRRLGRLIAQCVRRPTDYAARYGGEEFAVILPNSDLHMAEAIAERIRFSIASSEILLQGKRAIPTTVSIGISGRTATKERSPRELIRNADAALYDAKRAGRNCTRARQ
jgi:diguanylate cyclase (GGDEF)-like protein/PAS domain S-box-containing protein